MTTIERFPGVTTGDWNDERQVRIGRALVHLEHRMRERHSDRGMDQVGYRSDMTQLTVIPLQPHAPGMPSCIAFNQYRLTSPRGIDEITELVHAVMPDILAANRSGRRRERLLGRSLDEEGNVVTDAAHWRFEPLFEPMARALGFDPGAPIRLTPSVYEAEPPMGARIAERRCGGVVLDGFVHDDMIETCFTFDEGPLESFAMSPGTIDIHLREGLPETVADALLGRPLSSLVQIGGLPPAVLAMRIAHVHMGDKDHHIGVRAKRFVRLKGGC